MYYIKYTYVMKNHPLSKQKWETQIGHLWPAIKGSLAKVHKPCIRKNCPACARGDNHAAWLFSFSSAGRRKVMYVPLAFVTTMKKALENGRKIEKILQCAGPELLLEHRKKLKQTRKTKRKS